MRHQDTQADVHDALASMLQSFDANGNYRVEEILKDSPVEQTQRVVRLGDRGEDSIDGSGCGPFIRKYIRRDSELGGVYRLLYDACTHGYRFEHLPQVYACDDIGDRLVVLMECIPGKTLDECVKSCTDKETRVQLAAETFPSLCDAAKELHTAFPQPIVHRDLTPTNVVVGEGAPRKVTLIDFGISRTYKPEADSDTTYLGTRPYAPPEQFGFGQTSVRSDIYALGAILFFCLTGAPMTRHDRNAGFMMPGIAAELSGVVAKACALDEQDRYSNCDELKKAFEYAVRWTDIDAKHTAGQAMRATSRPVAAKDPGKTIETASAKPAEDTQPATTKARRKPPATASVESHPTPRPKLLERMPTWVLRIWNALVVIVVAVLDAATIAAVPNIETQGQPHWFNAFYTVFFLVLFTAPGYFLLEKHRWRARHGRTRDAGMVRQALTCLLVLLTDFLCLVAFYYLFVAVGLIPPKQ